MFINTPIFADVLPTPYVNDEGVEKFPAFLLRTRNSIRGFVCPSVRPSVRLSIRPSVRPSVRHAFFQHMQSPFLLIGKKLPIQSKRMRDYYLAQGSIGWSVLSSIRLSACPFHQNLKNRLRWSGMIGNWIKSDNRLSGDINHSHHQIMVFANVSGLLICCKMQHFASDLQHFYWKRIAGNDLDYTCSLF